MVDVVKDGRDLLMDEENACMQDLGDILDTREKKINSMKGKQATIEEIATLAVLGRSYINALKRLLNNDQKTFEWYKKNDPQNRNYLVYLVRIKHTIAQIEIEEKMIAYNKGENVRDELANAKLVGRILNEILKEVFEAIKP